jgi:hypothetical protein
VAGIHGYTCGGVEWLVTGVDVGLICGDNIIGGARFCTENADVCTVHQDSPGFESRIETRMTVHERQRTHIRVSRQLGWNGGAELHLWWTRRGVGNHHAKN